MPNEGFTVTDLEGDNSSIINFGNVVHAINPTGSEYVFEYPSGWVLIGLPILINTLIYGHSSHASASYNDTVASNGAYNLAEFFKNHLYEFAEDTVPMHYKYINDHANGGLVGKIQIVKDEDGSAYLPTFNFNGIGNLNQEKGYQLKSDRTFFIKLFGTPIHNVNSGETEATFNFSDNRWYIIGYPFTYEIDASVFFASLVAQNKILIVKEFEGSAFMPQYNFDGIGAMKPGQGYQLKTQNI